MDKSRYVEGIIETYLIPGKLEEFISQVNDILADDVNMIFGDEKLTKLFKDVINEKDVASKVAKAKVLGDAVRVSSKLFSESFSTCNVHENGASDMVNVVDFPHANSNSNPVKSGDLNAIANQLSNTANLISGLAQLGVTGSKSAPMNYSDTNFAGGGRIQVTSGPSVSSIPASVPQDSEHVAVFAEDIREGDIYNGRKVMSITEEINPINGMTLYSFELDDRSVLKANEGTEVTFSSINDLVERAYNDYSNYSTYEGTGDDMNELDDFSYSQITAMDDFDRGIRSYDEDFSNIVGYHDTDMDFNVDEYLGVFSYLESAEDNDPVNILDSKMNEINNKLDALFSMNYSALEDSYDEDDDDWDGDDNSYFSEVDALSEIFSEMNDVVLDPDTGNIICTDDEDIFIFSDDLGGIAILDEYGNIVDFSEYDEIFSDM